MEDKNKEKTVVVKPVPWRPRSDFKSSKHTTTAGNVSSPSSSTEATNIIRPKTVRLRPSSNHFQAEIGPFLVSSSHCLCGNNWVYYFSFLVVIVLLLFPLISNTICRIICLNLELMISLIWLPKLMLPVSCLIWSDFFSFFCNPLNKKNETDFLFFIFYSAACF